jgi:cytochrome c
MDSSEFNKILMGVGFSVLAVFGINELTNAVYAVEKPETVAYLVAGLEEVPAEAAGGDDAGAAEALPDFGTVLASADLAAGEKAAAKCTACHTWTKGGANGIGPNLYAIVGANHAHLGDAFAYSKAMAAKSGEKWDYVALYEFIKAPAKAIKGTKMGFAGLKDSEDRINLIAYMRTWSDEPYPLPAPNPAGAPAEGAAPAGAPAGEAPAEGAAPAPEAAPAEGAAATPEATPAPAEEAPAETPAAAPEATPAATPEAAPAASPEPTPAATPAPTP